MKTSSTNIFTAYNRLINVVRLGLVLAISLGLLVFVGFGEARRTYPKYAIERLSAQGELVQTAMSGFLFADLPLNQYPGFGTVTQPILNSDPSILAFYVTNPQGEVVFANLSPNVDKLNTRQREDLPPQGQLQTSSFQPDEERYNVTENASFYQISYGLRSRFDEVGKLHAVLPKAVVADKITQSFWPVEAGAIVAVCLYMIFLFFTSKRWMVPEEEGTGRATGWQKGATNFLGGGYAVAFIIVAVLVIVTLTNIYQSGIRGKIQALNESLQYRLNSAFELGLNLEDFTGLKAVFDEYQAVNPDLSYVVLNKGDEVLIATDASQAGKTWAAPSDNFDESVAVGQDLSLHMGIHMGVPKSVVYRELWRSAKNFVALFVASAFLANFFFTLIRSASNRPELKKGQLHTQRGFLLSLIGPLYFLCIFVVQGLTAAFLPSYFKQLAASGNVTIDVSTLFSTYYVTYTLALFVTAKPADKHGPRPFLIGGALLIIAELLMLRFVHNFYIMFLVQAIAGFGEGMLFNAVFTYIITVSSRAQRTRGAAIIVTSLYGGWLSGTAIGALLAADPSVGLSGVFLLGAAIAVIVLLYAFIAIPSFQGENFGEAEMLFADRDPSTMTMTSVTREMMRQELEREKERRRVAQLTWFERLKYQMVTWFTDFDFLLAAFLIGVPLKIIVAGFFKASLPLVLERQNYPTEDVGQIMMLYFGGVLLSSAIVSRLADKMGNTRLVLFIGGVGSGVGLLMMGLIGLNIFAQPGYALATTLMLIGGMVVLGLAHGLIQAPIVTYISNTKTAQKFGQSTANSIYRFYERIGNIGGPLLIGFIMVSNDYQALTVAWIGAAILLCGLLFMVGGVRRKGVKVAKGAK
jgi:MFS family permease